MYRGGGDVGLMDDPVFAATEELRAWTVDVPPGKATGLLEQVVSLAKSREIEVLVLRADLVFGLDHLRSALHHARRAFSGGTNSSDSISMETLLYASGERQLSSAIKKMSVSRETRKVLIVQLTAGELAAGTEWAPFLETMGKAPPHRLREFGITDEEIATLGERNPGELVLEKVASVDILKK